MKTRTQGRRGELGIGRLEVLLVVLLAGLLGSLGCASLRRGAQASDRSRCEDNLKRIGTGFAMWLHDQEDKLPWQIPVAAGGSQGLKQVSDHFLSMSNYIQSPAVLACPGLARHRPPTDKWALLSDRHISYALNCDARVMMNSDSAGYFAVPSFIAVDMDLEGGRPGVCSRCPGNVMEFMTGPGMPLRWSRTNHVTIGHLINVDGSMASLTNEQLSGPAYFSEALRQTFHILLPK